MAQDEKASSNFDSADPEKVFEILQPIGEGAYGAVYKARDIRTQELVALKIMPSEAESGALEREVTLIKKCKSPYIANFKSSFLKDGNIWLAMEYCSAGAVLDIMKVLGDDDEITEDQICIIMRETLKGLSYLHSKNVLHRDIKAGNILLNNKGQCKLADFGVSKGLEHTMDQAKTVIGTPYWMAPETFQGKPYDTKADIWSLGITAIEMACGRPPHSDKPPLQAIFLIPKSPPPTLPEEDDWSDDFRDWLSKCCDKNSKTRPNANELLKHKWFKKQNLSLNITLELVKHVQPLIDQLREDQRNADTNDDDEYEDDYNDNYDEYDENDDNFDGGTMVQQYDDDDENDNDGDGDGDEDEYYGGTMVMAADPNDEDGNDEDYEDDDGAEQYGTMMINDDAMEAAKDQYGTPSNPTEATAVTTATTETESKTHNNENKNDNTAKAATTEKTESNTKTTEAKENEKKQNESNAKDVEIKRLLEFESVFKGNEYLDEYMPIPKDVTKTELIEIWHAVRNTSRDDKKIFEAFYKSILDQLDDFLAKMT